MEAYIIEQELLTLPVQKIKQIKKLCKDDDETCIFLFKNRCMIYPVRPIVCRTYGLPILYHEAEQTFVDYCRLNFTQLPIDYEFEEKAILDLNTFYAELIQIDKKYAQYISGQSWRPNNRRSLKNILFHLELKQK